MCGAAHGEDDRPMFTKIIVGVDGSETGRDAVVLAQALAAPDGELVLAYVWERSAGIGSAMTGADHPSHVGRQVVEHLRRAIDGPSRGVVRQASSAAEGLHALAGELEADLIVVGSARRQHDGRVLIHDDARAALHGASCAVAVAPRGYATWRGGIRRIGVGYEQTASGASALTAGRLLAAEKHATLVVRSVLFDDPRTGVAEELRARLEALDDVDEVEIRMGLLSEELQEMSEEVDLLILGSRGQGPARRMLFGSTADAMVREAHCPVLVLPRAPVRQPV